MSDRFDNEESTGFVSNIPQEVVDAMPYGPGMMVKAIFQKVWDYLNTNPTLQKEFAHALELWKQYRQDPAQDVVWENECRMVPWPDVSPKLSMGLCYPEEGREVLVEVTETGPLKVLPKLEGVPVRIVIRRVPGGNV